ncbi:hypothetical protein GE09DRAFT_1221663 [Coniochaeta sp. 2T2.1]|nr:hypothetical protein GE09DRAFT_1221663 [Coniochaeta sp. 2T2.1]
MADKFAGRTPLGWLLETLDNSKPARRSQPFFIQALSILLDYGANAEKDAEPGHKLLGLVASNSKVYPMESAAIADKLIRHGADPNQVGHEDKATPLMRALLHDISHATKDDYALVQGDLYRLRAPFNIRTSGIGRRYRHGAVNMRLTTLDDWNNPVIPRLLRAGANVSLSELKFAKAKLDIVGLSFDVSRL